jgi:hypothetical protein
MPEPPASRPVPVTVTRVPSWPTAGVTAVMVGSATYVHPSSRSTEAPVNADSTTAPKSPTAERLASTTPTVRLRVTMVAATPPSVTP